MNLSPPRAMIFMTGRNCERYVGAAIESLVFQTYAESHVLFVDDCSTDGTASIAATLLEAYFPGRHTRISNPEPWGKARNAHVHLRAALHQGDFVAVVDADDQLIVANILEQLADQYTAGFDAVWTNFETDRGAVGCNGPLDPFLSPRGQGWRSSHLFSFRAELLASVPEDRFQDARGEWLTAACDFAIAYPVLDQTRRYCYLPVRAYRYTASNPASHHNRDAQAQGLSSRKQMRCAQEVLAKPPLPCTRWLFGTHAAADQAIAMLHKRLQADPPVGGGSDLTVPGSRPDGIGPQAWVQAAAAMLSAQCPGLLNLALDGRGEPLAIEQAWRWWQWLKDGPARPRVLEVGGGMLAAPLHAMVHAMGGRILSACGDRERAVSLYARLHAAGIDAQVDHVPLAEAEFESVSGHFPDLQLLPEDAADFDLVVISGDCAGATPGDSLLALPMVASNINGAGFRVCLWSPDDRQLRHDARVLWGRVAPDLAIVDGAFSGAALCVHSN